VNLVDISRGRPANTNADRRRGPRIDRKKEALVMEYFTQQRQTLWFPKLDRDDDVAHQPRS
jgi:hypothetical protein